MLISTLALVTGMNPTHLRKDLAAVTTTTGTSSDLADTQIIDLNFLFLPSDAHSDCLNNNLLFPAYALNLNMKQT